MNAPENFPPALVDRFGRTVNYVRISVTDRCDFRCVYCMDEQMTFLPRARILTLEELALVGRAFAELGVRKIRLLTNNPRKYNAIKGYNLQITERLPLEVDATAENTRYLKTKRDKLGHDLRNLE